MWEFNSEETRKLAEITGSILDLPRVSVISATDEMFMLSIYCLEKNELKAIKHFFDVYQKHNLMTNEIKTKYDIFIGIMEGINERKNKIPYHPKGKTAQKKPSELKRYSRKELGTILRKYSFRSYQDKRKISENDYRYIIREIIKKYAGRYNSFLRVHLGI